MRTTSGRGTGIRTCAGCRAKAHRSDLVRLVAISAVDSIVEPIVVVVDVDKALPGRGVWLHQQLDCLDQAIARRAIGRALRLQHPVETEQVTAWFDHHVQASLIIDQESGLAADGHPMSSQR